jgi:hypothetical protein
VRQHFTHWQFGEFAEPNDWGNIKRDPYFLISVEINLNNIHMTVRMLNLGLKSAKGIIELLDQQ